MRPGTLIGMVALLKQQLSIQGSVVDVIDQSCAILGIPADEEEGRLQERADACYDAIFKQM